MNQTNFNRLVKIVEAGKIEGLSIMPDLGYMRLGADDDYCLIGNARPTDGREPFSFSYKSSNARLSIYLREWLDKHDYPVMIFLETTLYKRTRVSEGQTQYDRVRVYQDATELDQIISAVCDVAEKETE